MEWAKASEHLFRLPGVPARVVATASRSHDADPLTSPRRRPHSGRRDSAPLRYLGSSATRFGVVAPVAYIRQTTGDETSVRRLRRTRRRPGGPVLLHSGPSWALLGSSAEARVGLLVSSSRWARPPPLCSCRCRRAPFADRVVPGAAIADRPTGVGGSTGPRLHSGAVLQPPWVAQLNRASAAE